MLGVQRFAQVAVEFWVKRSLQANESLEGIFLPRKFGAGSLGMPVLELLHDRVKVPKVLRRARRGIANLRGVKHNDVPPYNLAKPQ